MCEYGLLLDFHHQLLAKVPVGQHVVHTYLELSFTSAPSYRAYWPLFLSLIRAVQYLKL